MKMKAFVGGVALQWWLNGSGGGYAGDRHHKATVGRWLGSHRTYGKGRLARDSSTDGDVMVNDWIWAPRTSTILCLARSMDEIARMN